MKKWFKNADVWKFINELKRKKSMAIIKLNRLNGNKNTKCQHS